MAEQPEVSFEHKNNMQEVPLAHYLEQLEQADPDAMAVRSGVAYDAATKTYTLTFLGREVQLVWPSGEAHFVSDGAEVPNAVRMLFMRLLLDGQLVETKGGFVAYQEIPWGDVYLQPFTGRCIKRLAYSFPNAAAFCEAAEKLGGKPFAGKGDGDYEFEFLDGLLLRLSFWERDDEFEPQSQWLFSDNFSLAFTAEDIAHVGDVICGALKRGF